MKFTLQLMTVVGLWFLLGCVSENYTRVYKVYPPKTGVEAANIAILTEKPPIPFVIIADFQFTGASENFIRNWAAKHGADAVLVSVSSRVSTTSGSFSSVGPEPKNVTKTGKGFYQPTSPSMVDIRGTVPKEEFEELGIVNGDIYGRPETAYNEIRKKAALVGADAVIINNQTTFGSRTIINGVAIKFKK